jgi:dipeptidyl aminopeptidase/acylaminoacyl peptidase
MTRTVRVHALCVLVSVAGRPAAAADGSFTLEQVMGSAFPSELTASPTGGKLAWVLNARGVRNVWVAEPPGYEGRAVTSYKEDDGQELSDLSWTPDATGLVYVRGGNANRQGELPNPTSRTEGVEQAVWVQAIAGGEPRRLGEGHSPAVSPKGDGIAFINKTQVLWAPLDGSAKAEAILKLRGQPSALRWSPDGARLAFVSGRGDHSFIGVYDRGTKAVRWLEPSVDRDRDPAWSPDGTRVAFLRLPASKTFFSFGPQRTAEPWSIRVADVASGRGREVFRAEEGPGSAFHGVASDSQLGWAAGDRLVFPWEKGGWTRLYSVPAGGGATTLLTPGSFEVEHVALTADRRQVVYSSNQDDVDRRHLWTVDPAGGRPSPLTSGTGIEWSPAPISDGEAVAFLRSDARRPAHAVIQGGGGPARELAPAAIPADFPQASLVVPTAVTVTASDGMPIPAQLFVPDAKTARAGERRPAVIFFHGGSRRQMLLGWHYLGYYHNAYAFNQYLASRGYVVLSVNYRSGTGYGLEFREAVDYGAHGGSEFADVVGAGLYLRGRPDVDTKRIGLWGGSYGGYLTAMGLARASDLFAAGVDIHGVHDWNMVIRNFTPSYDPAVRQDLARRAFESSPMASVKTWRSPVLLIHGDDDRNVPFSESVDLAEALREQGVAVEQLVFPDEVHSFLLHGSWLQAFRAAADFFDRRLPSVRH